MRNSMRWPLISLVGQAPVCQALEKFRGNLCHLNARGRSFCTPRMYICLLRAILPWYPCLHSRLNFMYNWIGFYIYIAEEHLQYRIAVCSLVQSLRNVREHYTTDMMCSLYIAKNIFLLFCLRWKELVHYSEVHKHWSTFQLAKTKNLWEIYRATGTRPFFSANLFCKGFAVKETWGKPHSNLDKSDKDISTCPYSAIIVAN